MVALWFGFIEGVSIAIKAIIEAINRGSFQAAQHTQSSTQHNAAAVQRVAESRVTATHCRHNEVSALSLKPVKTLMHSRNQEGIGNTLLLLLFMFHTYITCCKVRVLAAHCCCTWRRRREARVAGTACCASSSRRQYVRCLLLLLLITLQWCVMMCESNQYHLARWLMATIPT